MTLRAAEGWLQSPARTFVASATLGVHVHGTRSRVHTTNPTLEIHPGIVDLDLVPAVDARPPRPPAPPRRATSRCAACDSTRGRALEGNSYCNPRPRHDHAARPSQ